MTRKTPKPESRADRSRTATSTLAGRGQRLSRLVPDRRGDGPDVLLWLLILCLALALILMATAPADASALRPSASSSITGERP